MYEHRLLVFPLNILGVQGATHHIRHLFSYRRTGINTIPLAHGTLSLLYDVLGSKCLNNEAPAILVTMTCEADWRRISVADIPRRLNEDVLFNQYDKSTLYIMCDESGKGYTDDTFAEANQMELLTSLHMKLVDL